MKRVLVLPALIPLGLVLWLTYGANWSAMRGWLGMSYVVVFACACVAALLLPGVAGIAGRAIVYHCSKFSGILLFAWLKWGLCVGWMSGAFGWCVLGALLVAYLIGLILFPLGPLAFTLANDEKESNP